MAFPDDGRRWMSGDGQQVSQCAYCRLKHGGEATCDAFPDGIPQEILTNTFDHREVHPDQDNDLTYTFPLVER